MAGMIQEMDRKREFGSAQLVLLGWDPLLQSSGHTVTCDELYMDCMMLPGRPTPVGCLVL